MKVSNTPLDRQAMSLITPLMSVGGGNDIFVRWLDQCKLEPALKESFMELPGIVHECAETSDVEVLARFVDRMELAGKLSDGGVDHVPPSLQILISDCYVLLKRYRDALEFFPLLPIGPRTSSRTDTLLSLKLATNARVSARDVLTLCGPKVTEYGKEHLEAVAEQIEWLLDTLWTETGFNHVAEWATGSYKYQYQVFVGWPIGYYLTKMTDLSAHAFSNNTEAVKFISDITRESENRVRNQQGIPNVGEGWVSETRLYYEVKVALSNEQVLQHASPKWLGRQHLDIFIPALNIAIEYQGTQHDKPVDYFGGQEAYAQTIKRDEHKRRVCKRNGVTLIYVREGYSLSQLLEGIAAKAVRSS